MNDVEKLTELLRACGALMPGGKFAECVEPEISELARRTLDRIHRKNLDEISVEEIETILRCYQLVVTCVLFPGTASFTMPKLYTRRNGGEPFTTETVDPIDAARWRVAGNA